MLNIPATIDQPRDQVQKSFAKLTEARTWLSDTRDEMALSTYVKPAKDTVADVAEKWLETRERDVKAGTLRTVSVEGYRSALTGVALHIGAVPVQKLTTTDVRHLLVTLATDGGVQRRPLSHRSVVYALTSLRLVLDYAVESGLIQKNPADAVKTPKKPVEDEPEQITTWDRDQLVTFRRYLADLSAEVLAVDPWLNVGYRLSLSGLRRSEVLGLAWEAVDLDNGQVHVHASRVKTGRKKLTERGKAKANNSVRWVPVEVIAPGTVAALRALWMLQGRSADDSLVIRDALGDLVHPDAFSARFDKLVAAAGLPHLTEIHHIRHSLARALHEANFKPIEGASLLGHSLATHLQHYLPTGDEYVRGAEARLRDLFKDAV
ncbi:tyrosine-type recombinase/integrase [Nocardioides sp. NBC_00850]|uniref:site-specific integrase n=1 Tax=Nocardioides sp. NBC_00850 TaxID=2976001 RepID=UPI003869B188|nr:tyrosine-type recombinase/integrase [Nocardioides sp. NBC_00850]